MFYKTAAFNYLLLFLTCVIRLNSLVAGEEVQDPRDEIITTPTHAASSTTTPVPQTTATTNAGTSTTPDSGARTDTTSPGTNAGTSPTPDSGSRTDTTSPGTNAGTSPTPDSGTRTDTTSPGGNTEVTPTPSGDITVSPPSPTNSPPCPAIIFNGCVIAVSPMCFSCANNCTFYIPPINFTEEGSTVSTNISHLPCDICTSMQAQNNSPMGMFGIYNICQFSPSCGCYPCEEPPLLGSANPGVESRISLESGLSESSGLTNKEKKEVLKFLKKILGHKNAGDILKTVLEDAEKEIEKEVHNTPPIHHFTPLPLIFTPEPPEHSKDDDNILDHHEHHDNDNSHNHHTNEGQGPPHKPHNDSHSEIPMLDHHEHSTDDDNILDDHEHHDNDNSHNHHTNEGQGPPHKPHNHTHIEIPILTPKPPEHSIEDHNILDHHEHHHNDNSHNHHANEGQGPPHKPHNDSHSEIPILTPKPPEHSIDIQYHHHHHHHHHPPDSDDSSAAQDSLPQNVLEKIKDFLKIILGSTESDAKELLNIILESPIIQKALAKDGMMSSVAVSGRDMLEDDSQKKAGAHSKQDIINMIRKVIGRSL